MVQRTDKKPDWFPAGMNFEMADT